MTERAWARLAIGVALLPLVVAGVALVLDAGSYLPISDHALIELRIRDIGRHPVLTGLYSRNDWSHPGPLFSYLLVPLYRLSGSASMAVNIGTLAINGASIAGMALIARRRGGLPMAVSSLAASALLVRTLGIDFLSDPWNTYVTVLPFALLAFLVWAMACGETWALPVGALVASFLAQTHVGFVVLALPLFALGAVWFVVSERRVPRRAAAWTAAVLLVVWSPVALDLVTGTSGNLGRAVAWFRDAGEGAHTLLQGWRVITGQLAIPPEWLVSHREPLWLTGEPTFLYRTPVPWVLVLVAGAAWAYRRCGRPDDTRLLVVFAATASLGIIAVARTIGLAFDYRLRWTWVIGMLAGVAVGWAAWSLSAGAARRVLAAVAVTALVGARGVSTVVALRGEVPRQADGDALRAVLPGVLDVVGEGPGQVVVHDGGYAGASWYTRSLVLQLERRGIDARMPPAERFVVGDHRVLEPDAVTHALLVAVDGEIATRDREPGLRRIASWTSVSHAQVRDFERLVERLDRDVARGVLAPVDRAKALHDRGLARHDEAVAWAVAVYLDERVPNPDLGGRISGDASVG